MIKIPYEQLWDEADTVALGSVTGITTHWGDRGMIYRVVAIDVERCYKNPVNATTLYIRVEGGTIGNQGIWVEDQPEFIIGERALFFLASTDQTHMEQPLYIVPGLIQGKFTVIGDTAHAPGGPYLRISEDEITLMPEGSIELAEFVIPGNRTIFEDIYGTVGFTNPGGQGASGNVSITFTGVQGPCEGYVNTTTFWIGVGPGGYTGRELRLNFTLPGTYTASMDGKPATNFTIHEAGYMSEDYRFTGLTVEPSEPKAGQLIKATLTVSTTLKEETQCYYWMKIRQTQAQGEPMNPLNIYMMSETSPDADAANWYEFHAETPGTYKVTVWHKGTRVLQDTITVAAAQQSPPPEDQPGAIPGHPAAATLLGIVTAYITLKRLKPSHHTRDGGIYPQERCAHRHVEAYDIPCDLKAERSTQHSYTPHHSATDATTAPSHPGRATSTADTAAIRRHPKDP